MSQGTVVTELTREDAERLSSRIGLRIDSMAENWAGALPLIREAIERNAYAALGYPSHGAYVSDRFGDSLSKLGVDLRREVVRELTDAGLSTRAIAPVFGVSQKTIVKDTQVIPQVSPDDSGTLSPDGEATAPVEPPIPPGAVVNPQTGELVDGPVTTEHTITEKTKTVIGLDGKQYTHKPREPKPVPTGAEVEKQNDDELCRAFGRTLLNLEGLTHEAHREWIIRAWPTSGAAATPDAQELANPFSLRVLAEALNQLANEWENSNA